MSFPLFSSQVDKILTLLRSYDSWTTSPLSFALAGLDPHDQWSQLPDLKFCLLNSSLLLELPDGTIEDAMFIHQYLRNSDVLFLGQHPRIRLLDDAIRLTYPIDPSLVPSSRRPCLQAQRYNITDPRPPLIRFLFADEPLLRVEEALDLLSEVEIEVMRQIDPADCHWFTLRVDEHLTSVALSLKPVPAVPIMERPTFFTAPVRTFFKTVDPQDYLVFLGLSTPLKVMERLTRYVMTQGLLQGSSLQPDEPLQALGLKAGDKLNSLGLIGTMSRLPSEEEEKILDYIYWEQDNEIKRQFMIETQ